MRHNLDIFTTDHISLMFCREQMFVHMLLCICAYVYAAYVYVHTYMLLCIYDALSIAPPAFTNIIRGFVYKAW